MEKLTKTTEFSFTRGNKRLFGELVTPAGEGPHPAVILCHGYGGNHTHNMGFAAYFAENGFAAAAFDFAGGGWGNRSDGRSDEMSVLTEAEDLFAVMDGLGAMPEIDADNLFLFGQSQGGFVCSYAAGKRPQAVRGLVALFPAYVLQDDTRRRVPDPANIPARMEVMGMPLGAIYHRDALSFDIYDVIREYPGPALLFHGTADTLVPIAYSERAVKAFPSARLVAIEGAGHGFGPEDGAKVAEESLAFFRENLK
ncbi:MAG: alpha/beta fold hydrolase [Clostridia bacterium]|nr:alpha/beta fold hydrolase [Clostridia bacterium]